MDGYSDTYLNKQRCSHTLEVSKPWWKVDLGQVELVNEVYIVNRDLHGGAIQDRLNPFEIKVGRCYLVYSVIYLFIYLFIYLLAVWLFIGKILIEVSSSAMAGLNGALCYNTKTLQHINIKAQQFIDRNIKWVNE